MNDTDRYFRLDIVDKIAVVTPVGPGGDIAQEGSRVVWPALFERIRASGVQGIVVDFERLEYIGSTTLDWLAQMHRDSGLPMTLCCLSPTITEVLQVAGMDHLWSREDSVAAAVKRINTNPSSPG